MKPLTIILLIAANSLLAAPPPPTPSPTPASVRTYSGGIVDGTCNRNGQGPVIKNSPGTIITIHAAGLAPIGASYWVLLFNKTTAPVNGDVPAIAIPFVTAQTDSADRDYPDGLPMTTGISWALSTSPSVLSTTCAGMTLTVTYQ
jgi:hypothetical protein